MSHIILEGPDGSGKSTLANSLANSFGYTYRHNGLYPDDTPGELLDRYTQDLLCPTELVIDRCFLSELVYGKVMRNNDRLGPLGYTVMTRLARARGIRQVICRPRWELVMASWLEKRKDRYDPVQRKGDYVDAVTKLGSIYNLYHDIAIGERHHLDFNYEKMFPLQVAGSSNRWRALPAMMTGSPEAQYLVVGEQINLKERPDWDIPFHSLKASSRYITVALHEAAYEEKDLAFVNAFDMTGGANLLGVCQISLPQFVKAIALGDVAAEQCADNGIPFVKVPHPSYWKRFKSSRLQDYVNQLRSIHESPVRNLLRCVASAA